MPLVAFRFHLVAPIALIVNPLLLVPIAWALYGGLGVLVLGWFAPSLANVFGWFCHLNLGWIEAMVVAAQAIPPQFINNTGEFFSKTRFSKIGCHLFSPWWK